MLTRKTHRRPQTDAELRQEWQENLKTIKITSIVIGIIAAILAFCVGTIYILIEAGLTPIQIIMGAIGAKFDFIIIGTAVVYLDPAFRLLYRRLRRQPATPPAYKSAP